MIITEKLLFINTIYGCKIYGIQSVLEDVVEFDFGNILIEI